MLYPPKKMHINHIILWLILFIWIGEGILIEWFIDGIGIEKNRKELELKKWIEEKNWIEKKKLQWVGLGIWIYWMELTPALGMASLS